MKQGSSHFVDGRTGGKRAREVTAMLRKSAVFPNDDEYGRTLSAVVVACVDVALCSGGFFLFGVRVNEPARGALAFTGGQMRPGESFQDTAARHVRLDYHIPMSPKRFRVVRTDSYVFSKRAQPPVEAGCHMTGTTVFADVEPAEVRRIRCCGDSSALLWLAGRQALREPRILPAHRRAVADILAGRFQS